MGLEKRGVVENGTVFEMVGITTDKTFGGRIGCGRTSNAMNASSILVMGLERINIVRNFNSVEVVTKRVEGIRRR